MVVPLQLGSVLLRRSALRSLRLTSFSPSATSAASSASPFLPLRAVLRRGGLAGPAARTAAAAGGVVLGVTGSAVLLRVVKGKEEEGEGEGARQAGEALRVARAADKVHLVALAGETNRLRFAAPSWRRLAAFLANCAVASAISIGSGLLICLLPSVQGSPDTAFRLSSLLGLAYQVLVDGAGVPSFGKWLVGIEVVDGEGKPASLVQSLKRNVPMMSGEAISVLAFVCELASLGVLTDATRLISYLASATALYDISCVVTRPDQRRLGDRWAGTYVVLTEEAAARIAAGKDVTVTE